MSQVVPASIPEVTVIKGNKNAPWQAATAQGGNMRTVKFATALAAVLLAAPTAAQQYPQRPITIVVPFAAGGPTDVLARVLGDHMSRTLGQPVIIEDVTGAGGTIGSTRVAKAAPDGYTLVMGNIGTHAASANAKPAAPIASAPRKAPSHTKTRISMVMPATVGSLGGAAGNHA